MTQIGYLSPDDMRLVWAVCQYLKSSGFVIPKGRYNRQQIPPPVPIFVRNDSGEEIPAFACMQTTGTVEAGGMNYVTVEQPADTTGIAGGYLFNGLAPIEIDGYGIGHDGPECRMLTDGSTVTCGDKWQPTVSEWTIEPGGSMFTAIGADDIADDVMRGLVGSSGTTLYKVTMKEPWSAGVANCDIYSIDGVTFTDTGTDADVFDGLSIFTSLTTGDHLLALLQAGKYYAIQAPCP